MKDNKSGRATIAYGWCKYCKPNEGKKSCGCESVFGYICCRDAGHKGKHVACGSKHNISSWRVIQ